MTILKLSSKGQIALPIKTRISFGLKAGSQIQLIEAKDGLSLKLNTSLFPIQDIAACAGLIKVKGTGQKRNLDDFDAADFASNVQWIKHIIKAIDTNILARFFIDDPDDEQAAKQRPKATEILQQAVYVPIMVILELEWVMRGFYKINRADALQVYRMLLGFAHVEVEDHARVLQALDYYEQGLDFADSLHAVRSQDYQEFVTFVAKFAKKAEGLDGLKVELVF